MDENKNEMNHEEMQSDVPMPVSEQILQDDLTEQAPPIDIPKKRKRGKHAAIIASVCVIVVSSVLLICMALGLFTPQQPWDKTMDAVFPSFSMLEGMATQGGSISLDVSLGSDLSDRVKKEPVQLHAEAALGRGGVMISGSLGGKQHKADLGVIVDAKGAQIYSERLLDGGYSIAFEGLMEAIDQSIFAPDSGTDYELPQEIYDWLEEYVESLDDPDKDVIEFKEMRAVLDQMVEKVMETARVTHSDMTLALIDGNAKAQVTVITFDVSAVQIVRDILLDHWRNNPVFYDEMCDVLDVYSFGVENGEELDVHDLMDTLYHEIKTGLDEFIETAEQSEFKLDLTYATHKGYAVYVSADAYMTIDEDGERKTNGVTFSWTFTSRPARNPSYDIVLLAYEGDEREKVLTISNSQEGERFTFSASIDQDAILIKGRRIAQAQKFVFSVDEIDSRADGESSFEMSESVFTLTLVRGDQGVSRVDNDTELVSMTVEDMDALGEKLQREAEQFKVDVNAELGFDLFYETMTRRQQSILSVHEGMYDYAYDRESGHLFLATIKNGRHHILMYDLETMEQLAEIQLPREICAMDADGGYLAITDKINTGEVKSVLDVQIYDAHTLEHIKTLDMNRYGYFVYQYSGDLIVDESRLIYATGDQHCDILFVDIETEELIAKSQGSIYQCSLAIDRENHIVAANERGISTCVFYMFDSITGELIKKGYTTASYNQDPLYFDGISFLCYGYHFLLDGTEQTTSKLVTERPQSDREAKLLAMVYKDEDILVTLEQDKDGMYYTMFYAITGEGRPAPLFEKLEGELYTEIIKIGDGAYIAVTYRGNETALEYFTVESSSDLDF